MNASAFTLNLPAWQALAAQLHPRTWRSLWRPVPVLVLPGLTATHEEAEAQTDAPSHRDANPTSHDMGMPSYDTALLAWRDWCQNHQGQRCQVGLSSAWLMTGVVKQADAANTNAAMAAMAQRWSHYMNVGEEALARDWQVRATQTPGGWVVCATPCALLDDVRAVAQSHGVSLAWIGPWWTRSLQDWVHALLKRKAASNTATLRLADAGWCLHAQANAQGLQELWTEPARTKDTQDAVDTLQAKASLVPAPALSIQHSWHDDLNVSGVRQRSAWWAWLVLAAGAFALIWSIDHVDALRTAQDEASAQYQRLARADRQLRMNRALAMGPRHAPTSAAADSANTHTATTSSALPAPALTTTAAQSNALRMAQALAYPWPQSLNLLDVQAAAAQVVITQLSVSLDGGSQERVAVPWRVQTATRSDDDALRLAAHLPQGVLQSRAPLAQPFTTSAGQYALQTSLQFTPSAQGGQP